MISVELKLISIDQGISTDELESDNIWAFSSLYSEI